MKAPDRARRAGHVAASYWSAWPLFCLMACVAACQESGSGASAPSPDVGEATPEDSARDDVGSDVREPGEEEPAYTWYRDIAPLLETHCGACHLEGGQGVGDFFDRSVVRAFMPAILSAVRAGRMPPPASDPDCHPYVNADRWTLPSDFNQRLEGWSSAGFPDGDPADAVVVPPLPVGLDSPDLEVRLPAPYRPTFSDPRNPGNEYRCFVVEHGRSEPFAIRAMAPIIDRPELVHHIVLFKARRADVPAQNDPVRGYDCIDMTFFVGSGGGAELLTGDSGMISAWAPGSQAVVFSDGAGIRMDPDHVFILQMHYFDAGEGEVQADLSGYAFETVPRVRTQIIMAPFGPTGFRIPAGDDAYHRELRVTLPVPIRVHGVMPHMHYLGRSYHMWFRRGEHETCVVRSERYDFDNQLTYMFEEPIAVPAGAEIGFACTWNNSESNPNLFHRPPIEIGYGERTDEEMCFGFALVSIGR